MNIRLRITPIYSRPHWRPRRLRRQCQIPGMTRCPVESPLRAGRHPLRRAQHAARPQARRRLAEFVQQEGGINHDAEEHLTEPEGNDREQDETALRWLEESREKQRQEQEARIDPTPKQMEAWLESLDTAVQEVKRAMEPPKPAPQRTNETTREILTGSRLRIRSWSASCPNWRGISWKSVEGTNGKQGGDKALRCGSIDSQTAQVRQASRLRVTKALEKIQRANISTAGASTSFICA
jgi:hypothetical protein